METNEICSRCGEFLGSFIEICPICGKSQMSVEDYFQDLENEG